MLNWLLKTDYLGELGASKQFAPECWWARGILVESCYPVLATANTSEGFSFSSASQAELFTSPTLGTDGNVIKPEGSRHPAASRACTGLAMVQFDNTNKSEVTAAAVGGYSVEGAQTVPRAELAGGAKAGDMFNLVPSLLARWVVDADYLYKGCIRTLSCVEKSYKEIEGTIHADLWADVDMALTESILPMPDKVVSHLGLGQVITGQIDFQGYIANGVADVMASVTAPIVAPSVGSINCFRQVEELGHHICMRLAIVEWLSWKVIHNSHEVEMVIKPTAEVQSKASLIAAELFEKIEKSGHVLEGFLTGTGISGLKCSLCGRSHWSLDLRHWTSKPCDPVGVLSSSGASLAYWDVPEQRGSSSHDQPEIVRARSSIVIRGSLRQVKAEAKKLASVKKEAVGYAKANAKAADAAVKEALAARRGSKPTFTDPLPLGATIVPGWARLLHVSHKQLLFVGGMVLCPRCGSLASASKLGRLNLRCISELATGTARRVLLLKQGKLSGCSEFSCWPDGSCKKELKAVDTLRDAGDSS